MNLCLYLLPCYVKHYYTDIHIFYRSASVKDASSVEVMNLVLLVLQVHRIVQIV